MFTWLESGLKCGFRILVCRLNDEGTWRMTAPRKFEARPGRSIAGWRSSSAPFFLYPFADSASADSPYLDWKLDAWKLSGSSVLITLGLLAPSDVEAEMPERNERQLLGFLA